MGLRGLVRATVQWRQGFNGGSLHARNGLHMVKALACTGSYRACDCEGHRDLACAGSLEQELGHWESLHAELRAQLDAKDAELQQAVARAAELEAIKEQLGGEDVGAVVARAAQVGAGEIDGPGSGAAVGAGVQRDGGCRTSYMVVLG